MNIKDSVKKLSMVNSLYASRLEKLGIETIEDLVHHMPIRYDDFSNKKNIEDLLEDEIVTIQGKVTNSSTLTTWRYNRRFSVINATIEDKTASIRSVWFNQPFIASSLKQAKEKNKEIFLAGKVHKKIDLYFNAPAIEQVKSEPLHTNCLVAIYPQTRGITSRWLRYAIHTALQDIRPTESLPTELIEQESLMKRSLAFRQVHFPENKGQAQKARHRFGFEKLFIISLAILKNREKIEKNKTYEIPYSKKTEDLIKSLPYSLTASQQEAVKEILDDIASPSPMNRLLEGDVGSGKTIVALLTAFNVIMAGYKAIFMAPTEILAKQHYNNISEILKDHDISISLLTRTSKKDYEKADIIIGTHALIQKNVDLARIGLIIIDEQHRFGVEQRAHLLKNNQIKPHLLSMTATPIPRTLALTIYADLDISFLKESPKGRLPIKTYLIDSLVNTTAYNTISQELKNNKQIFVIFPLIEESEKLQLKAAQVEYEKLSKGVFQNYNVGLLHGKMKQKEKDEVMQKVLKQEIQVLVSTSVVEVGVDIKNATIMIIEEAQRFGLAQLHQFRGRVGRSSDKSYCFLVSEQANERLIEFAKTSDGFSLAKKDMELRGIGQLYGTQQSGIDKETIELLQNIDLVQIAKKRAQQYFPNLAKYPSLNKKVSSLHSIMHPE